MAAGNETHPPDQNLTPDQVFGETAMVAISVTVFSVAIGVFTWRQKWHFLQDTTIAMVLGSAVGAAVAYLGAGPLQSTVVLNSSFFFFVVLPPIMFESGYAINRPRFRKNFVFIVVTACVGVASTAFLAGAIMYGCSLIYPGTAYTSYTEALTFAAVLSATDPVSVLATFQAIPVHPDLDTLIFGEAALNDATSIILYQATLALTAPGATIDASSIGAAIGKMFGILFGALGVALLFAVVIALILKYVPFRLRGSAHEAGIVLGLAYCCYLFSSFFNLSGIISVMFCGIVCSEYVVPNLSPAGHENIENVLRSLSLLMENLLFAFLGLGFGAITNADRIFDAAVIAYTFIGTVAARFVTVAVLIPLCNLSRKSPEDRFGWREIVFVAYSGLRGGVAFVLTLDLSENPTLPTYYRALCLGTTLMVIFISVVFVGGGTARTMKILKVEYHPPDSGSSVARSIEFDVDNLGFENKLNMSGVYARIKRNFLAPILIRQPPETPSEAGSPVMITTEEVDLGELTPQIRAAMMHQHALGTGASAASRDRMAIPITDRDRPTETLYSPETESDWLALVSGNAGIAPKRAASISSRHSDVGGAGDTGSSPVSPAAMAAANATLDPVVEEHPES